MHVVVTGASSGIGWALAKAFDVDGNKLSLVGRRKELLEKLGKEISAETQAIDADLAADPIEWLHRAEETFGPTDILVNNAGASYVEPAEQVDDERCRKIFQLNVDTPIAATRHVLGGMIAKKHGVIINIASAAAFNHAPYFAHYTATKAALSGFSECLRMELKQSGVHVVTVYPGPIKTPMGDHNWGLFEETWATKLAPVGTTETLAKLVLSAIRRRRARVIYPRVLVLSWYFPWFARWAAARVVPRLKVDAGS